MKTDRVLLPLALLVALAATAGADETPLRKAEALFANRAEGARGAVAAPAAVDAALPLYRAAVVEAPDDPDVRWRLLRALHFRGAYCGASAAEQKRIYGEAKKVGDEGVARLEKRAAGKKGADRLAALKLPGAAELHVWTASVWGEWALVYGKLAAVKEGAAARIRDLSQTAIELDAAAEEGGGFRVLGRLHQESPKIPFLTGWVDREAAVTNLRKALASGPDNRTNQLFLGEALLEHQPKAKTEALAILRKCADAPPRPHLVVEEEFYREKARKALAGK